MTFEKDRLIDEAKLTRYIMKKEKPTDKRKKTLVCLHAPFHVV